MSSAETTTTPNVGTAAPGFTLPVAGSGGGATASLAAHRGREPVVLYFLRAFT